MWRDVSQLAGRSLRERKDLFTLTQERPKAIEIFYSYAHEDEWLRQELDKHLSSLKRQGLISVWHDRDIDAGTDWEHEVISHLNTAHLILLLISPDFIASEYCYGVEMARAIKRHEAGNACVIPLILRPTDWQGTPFGTLTCLPDPAIAVTSWPNRDEAFVNIIEGIRKALRTLRSVSSDRIAAPSPLWNIPYRRNPFFTGREDFLLRLRQTLTSAQKAALTQPQAISGLGGIGKTQMAVEYAYRYRESYQDVFWVEAETREEIVSGFVAIANLLRLPEKENPDQRLLITAVKRWLETHTDWLLVLDNADELAITADFLPAFHHGHILLTTRAQVMGEIAQGVIVEKMSSDEGASLLLRRAKMADTASTQEQAIAKKIAGMLDGLPLALDQAGAYIEETKCSLPEYMSIFQQQQRVLLGHRGGLAPTYPKSVATTWSLSFQKVERADHAAADLLRLCAFLAPDAIPREIIADGVAGFQRVRIAASNPLTLNAAIGELLKYSLVRRNPDQTLTIHRLVQAVLKEDMKKNIQRVWAKRAVVAVNRVFPDAVVEEWPRCESYLVQAQACAVLIGQYHIVSAEAARLLYQAGRYLHDRASYQQAEAFYKQALAIYKKAEGAEHAPVAMVLHEYGRLLHDQGQYKQAEPLYQQALAIRERALGSQHPLTAQTLNLLGKIYHDQGHYDQAEPLYLQTLAIWEQQLGPLDSKTALILNSLARLYRAQGRYEQAETYYRRSLTIREHTLGAQHLDTAQSLTNFGSFCRALGRYDEAEPLIRRALGIRELVLGPEHPITATTLDALGRLYHEQGRYEEAEPLYRRALAIREKLLGDPHLHTAVTLHNLAGLCSDQGRYEEAEPLYQRALAIREQVVGPQHPDTIRVLQDLTALRQKLSGQQKSTHLLVNREKFQESMQRNAETSYGLTLTIGLPFPDDICLRIKDIQNRLERLSPEKFAWYQREQLHATVVAPLRGRYRETPPLQRDELPTDLEGFVRDVNALFNSVQPFRLKLAHVTITEDGLVVVAGNATIEKSAFHLPGYAELDQPKHPHGGWYVTIGAVRTTELFASEEEQHTFERDFEFMRNRTIGRTTIAHVWLVHYAHRTLSRIMGKALFTLGGANAWEAEQLLETLSVGERNVREKQ